MRWYLAIVALICLEGAPVRARDGSAEMQAMRSNCVGDYFRYCAGLNPNGSEVRSCFHANRRGLSRDCSTAIDAYERLVPPARP